MKIQNLFGESRIGSGLLVLAMLCYAGIIGVMIVAIIIGGFCL